MSRLYDGHPRAEEEAIKITVPYQSVLAGHEMQVGKLKPYEEDRRNSAALLKVGMPYTNITGIGPHAVSPITQAQKIIKNDNSLTPFPFIDHQAEKKKTVQQMTDSLSVCSWSQTRFPVGSSTAKRRIVRNSDPLVNWSTIPQLKMKCPHCEQTNRSLQLHQREKKTNYNQITSRPT
ncbi:hypothetical protein TNCV_3981801 [Trichonephila clavipes]|nr:hypothetical protein TNCV_3981801 [Trichonephila clavipes]